jgi:hypothetical protein
VTSLTRLVLSFACTSCAWSAGRAQSGSSDEARSAEIEAFLAALPTWSASGAIDVSYGYKDNLLLSSASPERSPFVRGSAEFMLFRLPQDQFDFSFFGEVGATRYTDGKTVKDDAKAFLRTEPGYRIGETLKFAVPVTATYYDQVFDVSDTEVERLVAELKVTSIMAGPLVRWDFHPSWWVEAQAVGQRKRYDDHAYDADIGEGIVRLGWASGGWLESYVSGAQRWRDFDTRAQYSAAGRELVGTALKISEREGEIGFDVTWDHDARWKTGTRATVLEFRDNGSGYFNYREQRVAQELKWVAAKWMVRIAGSASRLDFDVQTVGLGIDPPSRLRDEYIGELQIDRKLTNRWSVFGGYTWERSRSNDPIASYTVNEGLLGMRWSWEK